LIAYLIPQFVPFPPFAVLVKEHTKKLRLKNTNAVSVTFCGCYCAVLVVLSKPEVKYERSMV